MTRARAGTAAASIRGAAAGLYANPTRSTRTWCETERPNGCPTAYSRDMPTVDVYRDAQTFS
jgi:hypothetical protein